MSLKIDLRNLAFSGAREAAAGRVSRPPAGTRLHPARTPLGGAQKGRQRYHCHHSQPRLLHQGTEPSFFF